MSHLAVNVLGALQVSLPDGSPARFESDKARALLVYLAVEAGRPHRRDALVALLWPNADEASARQNLRQALFSLRRAIGDAAAQPAYLLITRDAIQFNPAGAATLDLGRFEALLAACASHGHAQPDGCAACARRLQQAVDLYRGTFLQEFFLPDSEAFEEWATARREAVHQRALDALRDLADYHEQAGDLDAARGFAARQLELDPWREEAHRQLMRALALDGQRAAAIAHYERCRRLLAEGLGVEPSGETRRLHERILSGDLELEVGRGRAVPRAARGLAAPGSHLPSPATPLVGRERELADLRALLADRACRWLTLTGPGGIGKTRLALELAWGVQDEYAAGVHFVPLDPVGSARFLVPAIADALGFSFHSSGHDEPKMQLFHYLRTKQALLLVDNLEHLLAESGIDVLAELLASAPQVTLLVTSREPAGLAGEWVFELGGLSLPGSEGAAGDAGSGAVALFLQRAHRASVGFRPTPEDAAAIDRICRLVEGMPLGIELAAAWVRTLACAEIAQEIGQGLGFLNSATRALPARHRSLGAVFDQSWKLLSDAEQRALYGLSIFHGGFRREAAEEVAGAALATLSGLVAKSLVRRGAGGRYQLHELIRQFARDRGAEHPDAYAAAQARHGTYYLGLFARAGERLRGVAQREALAELAHEIGNIRTAWEWAVGHAEFAELGQTWRAFALVYDMHGWWEEGAAMLGRAVAALEAAGSAASDASGQAILGRLLTAQAWLLSRLGQHEQAQRLFERSLAILRTAGPGAGLAEAATFLGISLEWTGNYAQAGELFGEGLEAAVAAGDRWMAALCRTCLIDRAGVTGASAPEHTYEQARAVVAEWRSLGDPRMTAIALNSLGWSAAQLGRYDTARAAMEEGKALCESIGDRWGWGTALRGLGVAVQAAGEHAEAVDLFQQALAILSDLGARADVVLVLTQMGVSLSAQGDGAGAERAWGQALRVARETQNVYIVLEILVGLARVQGVRGNVAGADELLRVVLSHPAAREETRGRAEQVQHELETQLGGQRRDAAQARAAARSFDVVVEELLGAVAVAD